MIPLDQITTIIEENLPEAPYEKAVELRKLYDFAETLAKTALGRYNQEISAILQNCISDEKYRIVTPVRHVREPDIQKLKTQLPQIYETIAYIPAHHAEKILGRPAILAACRTADPERTENLIAANLGDLKTHLTEKEYANFTTRRTIPCAPEIRTHGDEA